MTGAVKTISTVTTCVLLFSLSVFMHFEATRQHRAYVRAHVAADHATNVTTYYASGGTSPETHYRHASTAFGGIVAVAAALLLLAIFRRTWTPWAFFAASMAVAVLTQMAIGYRV